MPRYHRVDPASSDNSRSLIQRAADRGRGRRAAESQSQLGMSIPVPSRRLHRIVSPHIKIGSMRGVYPSPCAPFFNGNANNSNCVPEPVGTGPGLNREEPTRERSLEWLDETTIRKRMSSQKRGGDSLAGD